MLNLLKKIAVCAIFTGVTMTSLAQELPTRDKIADKYKWNLKEIFADESSWQREYDALSKEFTKIASFKGKISQSANEFYSMLITKGDVEQRLMKLYMYASLGKDMDISQSNFQIMDDKMTQLLSDFSSITAFIRPEILSIPESKMAEFYKTEPKLVEFKHKLDALFILQKHTLPEEQEKMLAELDPVFSVATDAYGILNDVDLPFPVIKGPKGEDIQVSHGRYRSALFSQDRNLRKDIYMGNYVAYKQVLNTMSKLYNGRVKSRLANAKIRKYNSPVEASMKGDNIPVSVYENLVNATNANLKSLHRWASLKKKVLKLDELHPYDTYVSLFPSVQKEYTYDEAVDLCIKALAPLGKDYIDAMKKGFNENWIDVYETKNKRSGAYSNSSGCGPHPFILLNWNGTLDDVFTLAHELGHNMHSYFTEKSQPYQYRDYATFVAEVASTCNEALLLDYLIENAKSKEEKLMLIEKFLLSAQQTFFRQTRFAEFEKIVHEKAQKGEFMTAEMLTKEFGDGYKKYWGPEMVMDAEEGMSWARIPHLINYNFYVYQYATSFACSQALAENIKKEGQPAIDRYLTFLSSGSSAYPIEILKKAGVDMSTPGPIQAMFDKFNKYLDLLEKELK